ncbi:gtpase-activating protein [Anaeramoeba flamelloides]|uniref:Gtpase-activating protein n=1 Tax=Anaeramoeba flamelloides TaxID=1746091 RepID=A0AAV7YPQ4_9EUKA|nr:gtpase-activating protein [Anaeramoeba flamelloides]
MSNKKKEQTKQRVFESDKKEEKNLQQKTGGHELFKLQELLQTEKLAFEAEQDALSIIQKKMEDLNKKLQIGIVESMNMNKLMVTLNTIKVEYLLRSEEELNKWKVNINRNTSTLISTSKKIQYRSMLAKLRQNSDILIKAISSTFTLLSPNEMDILTHSAIFSLFGNVCNRLEEKKFIDFLIDALRIEFRSNSESQTLLSRNKALAKILSSYTKTTQTVRFVRSALREPILDVLQDTSLDLSEKDEKKIETMSKRLIYLCGNFIDSINKKVPLIPYGIRYLTQKLRELCIETNRSEDQNLVVSDFIFLRFLNPIIVTPERYNIITDIPILKRDRKNLTEIAKILLSLSRGTSLLRTSNKILGEKVTDSRLDVLPFFKNISNINKKSYKFTKITQSGNQIMINRKPRSKSIIISLNDIFILHKILFLYIHQVLQKKPQLYQKELNSDFILYIQKLGMPQEIVSDNKNKYFSFSIDFVLPPPPLSNLNLNKEKKKKSEKLRSKSLTIESSNKSKSLNKNNKNKNINKNTKRQDQKQERKNSSLNSESKFKKKLNINSGSDSDSEIEFESDTSSEKGKEQENNYGNNDGNTFTEEQEEEDFNLQIEKIKKKMKNEKSVGSVSEAFPKQTEQILKEAERKLRRVLCDLELITYNTDKTFLQILYHEMFAAKSSQSLSLACLLDSTIKTLENLPNGIKKSEFKPLIIKMKNEQKSRENELTKLINQKYEFQNAAKDIQELVEQNEEKMISFDNYIKSLLAIRFIEKNQEKFLMEINKFKNASSQEEMKNIVKQFFRNLKKLLKKDTLILSLVSQNSYQNILELIQNYAFIQSFDYIYLPPYLKSNSQLEDQQFSMKLVEIYTRVTPEFLNVPKKLWGKEIWVLAINQISSIIQYKTPILKLNCLAKCAKIINNIIIFSGTSEFGADLVLPIIIYIIIVSNPTNFPSNIHFIETFLDSQLLTKNTEYWFTMIQSAFTFLKNLDLNKLP